MIPGSGTVDFPEFLNMMAKKIQNTDSEEEIREAFRVFHKENNGHISREVLRFVMSNINAALTTKEIEELINDTDHDQDRQISYEGRIKYDRRLSVSDHV